MNINVMVDQYEHIDEGIPLIIYISGMISTSHTLSPFYITYSPSIHSLKVKMDDVTKNAIKNFKEEDVEILIKGGVDHREIIDILRMIS